MEDKINELERLKRVNKRSKIALIVLIGILSIIMILGVSLILEFYSNNNSDGIIAPEYMREIEAFNSKFASSMGYYKTGSVARHLCSIVMTNNINIADENRIVYIKFGDITGLDTREKWRNSDATCDEDEINSIMRTKINGRQRYHITASYDKNGRIMGIGIIEKTSSNTVQNIMNTNNM